MDSLAHRPPHIPAQLGLLPRLGLGPRRLCPVLRPPPQRQRLGHLPRLHALFVSPRLYGGCATGASVLVPDTASGLRTPPSAGAGGAVNGALAETVRAAPDAVHAGAGVADNEDAARPVVRRASAPPEEAPSGYGSHVVIISVLYGLALNAYVRAATLPPGPVPPALAVAAEKSRGSLRHDKPVAGTAAAEEAIEYFHDWDGSYDEVGPDTEFCGPCGKYKPPRAHHCKRCRACVLRMDHHCPWLGTCVGHGNYKAFLLTCLYFFITSAYNCISLWTFLGSCIGSLGAYNEAYPLEMAAVMGHTALSIFTVCFAALLTGSHLHLAASNATTIEAKARMGERPGRLRRLRRRFPHLTPPRFHRYDHGVVGNLREVLGPSPWSWWNPNIVPPSSGLRFRISDLHRDEALRLIRACEVQRV
ncbi:palmitoyltransferase pfa3 [Thecamonas trahens ATCC 50062]|uniref:Palmitoyltransferase n=1 Tax=Thecamonas trahens ATCC 50062 TaxID=461836 RepID=A0A0L0DK03_THETB|nr:palmitoyltransferase pfa3 [Thecamonas trahens ATCC 50062]KNC52739.1 palmitoyltransferase pfa3 [Thecamonas trahens ATCC 50062]|eukprot:XP_013755053.1 palmitoyltransferase pfa3 [Thecamonas trahens ATCC 50062]